MTIKFRSRFLILEMRRIIQGTGRKVVERQMRNRLGASLARRAARMSLATWGKDEGIIDVILPIVEYDGLDRSTEEIPIEPPPGLDGEDREQASLCAKLLRAQIG